MYIWIKSFSELRSKSNIFLTSDLDLDLNYFVTLHPGQDLNVLLSSDIDLNLKIIPS